MFSFPNIYKYTLILTIFTAALSHCNSTNPVQPAQTEEAFSSTAPSQPPVDPVIRREGQTVYIEMTSQVTDIEIAKGVVYNAWTFNGTSPGPVLRVKEGDTIVFTLKQRYPHEPLYGHACGSCFSD